MRVRLEKRSVDGCLRRSRHTYAAMAMGMKPNTTRKPGQAKPPATPQSAPTCPPVDSRYATEPNERQGTTHEQNENAGHSEDRGSFSSFGLDDESGTKVAIHILQLLLVIGAVVSSASH